jgi:hypothetical protein
MVATTAPTYLSRWLCFVAGLFTFLSRVGQFMVFGTVRQVARTPRQFMARICDEVRARPLHQVCKAGGVFVS